VRKVLLAMLMSSVLLLSLATPALAATRISGTVRDINSQAPVKGAVVSSGKYRAKSNSHGYFSVKLKAGRQLLTVSVKGYLTTSQIGVAKSGGNVVLNWFLTHSYPSHPVPAHAVTVLAWNDLGMHCDQDSYRYFMVLPPFNTLHAQVFGGGGEGVRQTGYTVSYSFPKKTDSTLHTDFWQYASNFGYNLAPNVGLTGNGLTGTMKPDARGIGYVADGIPVTPYDDDGTWDPYGTATLTVRNSGGQVVATTSVVVPVSTEMDCSNCHGANFPEDILNKHDTNVGTTLLADANAGHPHACAECHADNALGRSGAPGIESLSVAMHKQHDGLLPNTTAGCMNCHPGPKTQCLRGIMARAGKGCPDCHGSMSAVWQSQVNQGRQAWLNEPTCAQCHGSKHAENPGTLYRNSVLGNTYEDMSGRIYCEACHNSTHAEPTSANPADAVVTRTYQGDNYWIYNCAVCHKGGGEDGAVFHGQAIHR
jgi:hypothetical protein